MAQVSPVLRDWVDGAGTRRVLYWCAGCKCAHHVPVNRPGGDRPNWTYNDNPSAPTLTPSVRHFYTRPGGEEVTTCHYIITDGSIAYCGDCKHDLTGQTIPLPVLPPATDYGYPDE